MHITKYGQSALLIEDAGTRILLDPGTFCSDQAFALTSLDAVLITHEHADHCDLDRVGQLLEGNPTAQVFAPAAVLDMMGLSEVPVGHAVANGASFAVGAFNIEPVGTLHQVILPELPRCANSGFIVTATDGTRLFHPGDSYETVPADIDVLAVPLLGQWSSLRETVDFVKAVAPSRMFPFHDAFLSDSGRELFWRILTGATGPGIAHFETAEPTGGHHAA